MEKGLMGFFNKRLNFKNFECRIVDLIAFACVTALSLYLRYSLRNTVSADYTYCLGPWYSQIKELGGIASLKYNIGNYSPPYMYLLTMATYLPLQSLGAVKCITLFFDYVFAAVVFVLVCFWKRRSPNGFMQATIAWGVALFLPSAVLNGAVWAQCDIIYSLFCLLCFLCIWYNRPNLGCVFFGIAFSFKMQAAFFAPMLLVFWFFKKVKLKHFLWIPAVYLLSILPAVLAGRGLWDILSIYLNQKGIQVKLTANFPNIYQIVGESYAGYFSDGAVIFTFALLGMLLYYLFSKKDSIHFDLELAFLYGVFFLLFVPYFLPHMHERYSFPADIFCVALFFYCKKYFWLVITTQMLSLLSYQKFLFQNVVISYPVVAVFYLGLLCILALQIYRRSFCGKLENSCL